MRLTKIAFNVLVIDIMQLSTNERELDFLVLYIKIIHKLQSIGTVRHLFIDQNRSK